MLAKGVRIPEFSPPVLAAAKEAPSTSTAADERRWTAETAGTGPASSSDSKLAAYRNKDSSCRST